MNRRPVGAWLVAAAGAAVVLSLAATIAVIGTPAEQRLARLDERRVADLDDLDDAIQDHAREQRALPATLDALGAVVTDRERRDPETGAPYGYRRIDARRYALCADFARPTPSDAARAGYVAREWRHPAGRHCFTRTRIAGTGGNAASALADPDAHVTLDAP